MNRLLKRHKRQVLRAKEKVKTSEPDLRTPEQRLAARESSGFTATRHNAHNPLYSKPPAAGKS